MLTHPTALFSGDYISALSRCWPLKFLHTLQPLKCISSRMWGAGRPHVGLCPIFLVFACFWLPIFWIGSRILGMHYKAHPDSDDVPKFHVNRPMELGNPMVTSQCSTLVRYTVVRATFKVSGKPRILYSRSPLTP